MDLNSEMKSYAVFFWMISVAFATSSLEQAIQVKSVVWYSNSKVICVEMENVLTDKFKFKISPRDMKLTMFDESNSRSTIVLGNHPCHLNEKTNAICGFIPDDVESSSYIRLGFILGSIQIIRIPYTGKDDIKLHRIHIPIDSFSSHGKVASLSMKNICHLHIDKCENCQQSCESVMKDNGKLLCDGIIKNFTETSERLVPRNEEMPFFVESMNVTGVAFPQIKVFCIVLKRPVHKLGNIFRYLRYIADKTMITYVDENQKGGQILFVPNDEICIPNIAMENKNDIDAMCARYIVMPQYIFSFQGSLTIHGFNREEDIYTFSKSNFHLWVNKHVLVQDEADACVNKNNTCQSFVTGNGFICTENTTEHFFPFSNATNLSQNVTDEIVSAMMPKTSSSKIPTSTVKMTAEKKKEQQSKYRTREKTRVEEEKQQKYMQYSLFSDINVSSKTSPLSKCPILLLALLFSSYLY